MKIKVYKCAFTHCAHPDHAVTENEAIKINKRYWHRDCYEISKIIEEIVNDYIENFSRTVVITMLRGIINNIVFGNKLLNPNIPKNESDLNAAKYLEFAIQYAINHNIKISHPQGLYYLIDNSKIKEAWQKKNEAKVQREVNKSIDVSESNQTSFTLNNNNNTGFGKFGDILAQGGNSD